MRFDIVNFDPATVGFLLQNNDLSAVLTKKQINLLSYYTKEHSGGLMVAGRYFGSRAGSYAKIHDTWGDPEDGLIVVHLYDPEGDDPEDVILHFNDGKAAADLFLNDEALVAIWKATR
jgi:hypothetical protein